MRVTKSIPVCLIVSLLLVAAVNPAAASNLNPLQQLGKKLFFDANLSNPAGQSCSSCHLPKAGFADPDKALPVSEGVVAGRFGFRNSPTAAYAGYSPVFSAGLMLGGQFWDGRANDLQAQALQPFLNIVEMNNTEAGVVGAVRADPSYLPLFTQAFADLSWWTDDAIFYGKIGEAIAAYELSGEVCRFTSKFDAFWRRCQVAGIDPITLASPVNPVGILNDMEYKGFLVFKTKGKCIICHTLDNLVRNPNSPADRPEYLPVFSDFKYHNLGIPKNPANPWYAMPPEFNPLGADFIDLGLARNPAYIPGTAAYDAATGKFKTSTLRNIAKTAPYGHNGYFSSPMGASQSLMMIVHFYNTRDVPGAGWPPMGPGLVPWPPAEVPVNVNNTDMGNLGLLDTEGLTLIAFMMTLNDGYVGFNPAPINLLLSE
jgi:cytochrome c peroxidase